MIYKSNAQVFSQNYNELIKENNSNYTSRADGNKKEYENSKRKLEKCLFDNLDRNIFNLLFFLIIYPIIKR